MLVLVLFCYLVCGSSVSRSWRLAGIVDGQNRLDRAVPDLLDLKTYYLTWGILGLAPKNLARWGLQLLEHSTTEGFALKPKKKAEGNWIFRGILL